MFSRHYFWMIAILASLSSPARAQDKPAQLSGGNSTVSERSSSSEERGELSPDGTYDSAQSHTSGDRRSFFTADLHASEDAESDVAGGPGDSAYSSVANAIAGIHLLSLQHRSESAIDYLGGGQFYGSNGYAIQQLNAEQRFLWRRTALTVADMFGQLPGGSVGATWFGGVSLLNLATQGYAIPPQSTISNFFGANDISGITQNPSISNISLVQVSEALTPRSSVALTAGYGETKYSRRELTGLSLINNQELGGQLDYIYALNRRDQIGFAGSYRRYQFPGAQGGNVFTNLVQVSFGHRISTRVKVDIAAGPEFTRLSSVTARAVDQLNASGHASLNYALRSSSFTLSYDRGVTSGSGLFVGANTDIVQVSAVRRYREFTLSTAAGYSRLSQIAQPSLRTPSQAYQYSFAGAGVQKQFGRYVYATAGYQFNDQHLNNSLCVPPASCTSIGQGQTFSLGIDVTARPRRLE